MFRIFGCILDCAPKGAHTFFTIDSGYWVRRRWLRVVARSRLRKSDAYDNLSAGYSAFGFD